MAKPTKPKPDNHGQAVSAFVHEAQAARGDGHPGIGHLVSEFARNGGGEEPTDFEDGVITVVSAADGSTQSFATFAEAIEAAQAGDTLQVGAGSYAESFSLDKLLTIVGEEGAVIDGSGIEGSPGVPATIQIYDGFSGGSISGLTINAVQDGNAVVTITGETITDVSLTGNLFDAGANELGPLVYFNPGVTGVVIEGNTFEGAALTGSPLLGIEADNVEVTDNTFGAITGPYAKVEIFEGGDGSTDDVVLVGNNLAPEEIAYS